MKKTNQSAIILIGLLLGVCVGLLLPEISQSLRFLGDIFLRLVQMALPILVLGQVSAAIAHIDISKLGKLGSRTLVTFFSSVVLASVWGTIIAIVFKPGKGLSVVNQVESATQANNQSIISVITDFFSDNIFTSLTEGNLLQITVFAVFFGVAISLLQTEKGKVLNLTQIIDELNETIMKIMAIVMKFAPIGVFSLTATAMANYGIAVMLPMLYYIVVFLFALLSYMFICYLICALYTKTSVWQLIKQTFPMSFFAFSVNSSAVALPTQIKDAKEKLGFSDELTSFIMPLGMNINSPGSALSNAFVLVMAGQMYGMHYHFSDYLMIIFIGIAASYATAVIPGGGLVSLNIVLPSMGFGAETIGIFATVDYPTGMMRTMTNVNLDAQAGVLVAESLDAIDYDVLNEKESKQV